MSSGYKGNNNYRKYNPSGYKVSSYNRGYKKKKRNYKRIRNRIIIVTVGVLLCALIIFLFSLFMKNCVCASCNNAEEKITATETIDPNATQAPTTAGETTAQETTEPAVQEVEFVTPNIKDDNSNGKTIAGFYVWNNQAFDAFTGDNEKAKSYANYVNKINGKLGDDVKVYSMLVPSSIELNLPDRLKNTDKGIATNSQKDYIKKAYSLLDKDVTPIYAYNTLAKHCNEKIYFNTDYRWTGLGAYYGYTAFTEATSQKALSLDNCKEKSISGFAGSYADTQISSESIKYWDFNYGVSVDITANSGEVVTTPTCYYEAAQNQEPYGRHIVYLQGDYHEVITSNSKSASNEKIAIVHNSFGRFAVPYFTYNYSEVHSLNTLSFDGDIAQYCKDNGITTLLFISSVESSLD